MYIVIELQTNAEGAVSNIVTTYADKSEAEGKYHGILAAAAVSAVPVHTAVMIDELGHMHRHESYSHSAAQEPEG